MRRGKALSIGLGVLLSVILFAGTVTTSDAAFVSFEVGDVFASVGNGSVQQWRDVSGTWTLMGAGSDGKGGYTTGSTTDAAGNLYVTNFSANTVAKYDATGALVNANWNVGAAGTASNESILFDKAGNAYIGHADGNADITKVDSTGANLTSYNVATEIRGSDWIDLAADQKTMFYTSEGFTIKRFDLSTNTQLADFATLPGEPAFALRLLSDGGLLVADSANILRLDSSGAITQTYDASGQNSWFALNLDANGTTFWSGDYGTGHFFAFDIASGAQLFDVNTSSSQLFGLSVYGEKTEGGGGVGGKVPEPATMILLGSGLVGLAAWRRKK